MEAYLCVTCGTQFSASDQPPEQCPICDDERQYVPQTGQQWTTLAEVQREYRNKIRAEAPNVIGIGTEPAFASG